MGSAYEIPNLRFSLEAAGPVARRRFVAVDANGKGVQANLDDADAIVGVSMNDPDTGEVLEVADGIVMVEAGAAVVAGVEVEHDGDGRAITKNLGVAVGRAMTSAAAAGELITVKTHI